ncbi:MAG: hypothetical protein UT16_C0010G0003 [Candidatus Azambacteria bacterium GW2011_GWA2_39_10]|uniref:Uncharacterized protein n=1 Tax=Candidatus Azambacteria bacterium GW2011_GWA2_39_10 TaxID=1618611 RepID=A0A0G0LVB6_9BACT|nr:MAG: hypothetical protein UT16_C0010G0003 [Candidatus Azambacteria bacterium GW2011_GWA2_39_10]
MAEHDRLADFFYKIWCFIISLAAAIGLLLPLTLFLGILVIWCLILFVVTVVGLPLLIVIWLLGIL